MSKLTAEIKNAGLHDSSCNCFAISEKEAMRAIELVKDAVIEAIANRKRAGMGWEFNVAIDEAIQSVHEVK